MILRLSTRNLVLIAVLALAIAAGGASYAQRSASRTGFDEQRTAQSLLTAMLDQETGVRGFAITADETFLAPYRKGQRDYAAALVEARSGADHARAALEQADAAARSWRASARTEIAQLRRGERRQALAREPMGARKGHMNDFRRHNARYSAQVAGHSQALETRALYISVGLVAALGAFFSLAGALLSRHAARVSAASRARNERFEHRQRDLGLGLQVTESEEEAQEFLQRHLQGSIAGSEVVVLKRDTGANRLLPGTPLPEGSPLEDRLVEAEPRDCLAVRLAQRRVRSDTDDSVLQCGLCGKFATQATCTPLRVGGEVIGSVLVGHRESLDDFAARAIDESVKQAAPVLANLRNLAIAETRASTDGLTGLPNRRSFEEALKRMVAHGNRAMSPLAAVALDLDHFKKINDVHGHGRGDDVLAGVGALLKTMLRDSDFPARIGGEEFMLLLPDTGRDGALVICERLRAAVEALDVPGLDEPVTTSMGVAVLPEDATEGSALIRAADRMLYVAKDRGRNRVEITELSLGPAPDGAPA